MRNLVAVCVGLLLPASCLWAYVSVGPVLEEASHAQTFGLALICGVGFWVASQPRPERLHTPPQKPQYDLS